MSGRTGSAALPPRTRLRGEMPTIFFCTALNDFIKYATLAIRLVVLAVCSKFPMELKLNKI